MTPRSFWIIFVKILGIWLIIELFTIISPVLTIFISSLSLSSFTEIISILATIVLITAFYVLIIWLCLFKPGLIIEKLKLDIGFEEEKFEWNIHRSSVLRISVIVLGGLTFVHSFPALLNAIYSLYRSRNSIIVNRDTSWLIIDLIKTILGYFLMTNSQLIVNLIERNRKRKPGGGDL
jgi:hypothetical protein